MPPWLTQEIKQAMADRDQSKREKRFNDYRSHRNHVKTLVRQAKKTFFRQIIDKKKNIISVWRALNTFTKPRQAKPATNISPDDFNNHFLSVADSLIQKHQVNHDADISDKLANFCNEKLGADTTFQIPLMSVHDVGKCISQLKNKRTSGHDWISSNILKLSLPYIVNSLTFIFNLSIQHNIFPTLLKRAKVIPLPKTKDLNDPNKFRPISILSTLSKPLERHIHRHLYQYLDSHKLIYNLQSGFRPQHSCSTALSYLTNSWLTSIKVHKMIGVAFLDLSKAFDLVNHELLLKKLACYHIGVGALNFFRSYLESRTQSVYVNGSYSSEGFIKHGVPQGSILGPLLFSLFINDLPLSITNPNVSCTLFADDATLDFAALEVLQIEESLQSALNDISSWCFSNKMVLNPTKTECMLVAPRQKLQKDLPPLNLFLNSHPIQQVREHRTLGVTIDHCLEWQPHLDNVCKSVSKNLFLLSKLRYFIDAETRKMFFNAHIRPHIDYISVIWDLTSNNSLKKLNSLYRRSAKLIHDRTPISTDEKLRALHMLPLELHLLMNKAVFMRKVTLTKTPLHITELFPRTTNPYAGLRNELVVPWPRIDLVKTSISFSGARLWNALPISIRSIKNIDTFKAQLHAYLSTENGSTRMMLHLKP